MLKDIFHFGLNEPIKSCLPEGKLNCSLKDFVDYALLCADSSFTVGVAEEERDTASVTERADAPECTHKMAEATTHHNFSVNRHEASHITADHPESGHVTADPPESLHISADLPESLHVSADHPESLHISADHHRVRSRARSVPGADRVRSRARSVPGAHRARSVPGAHRVRSSAPAGSV